jgi:hypothetical protein
MLEPRLMKIQLTSGIPKWFWNFKSSFLNHFCIVSKFCGGHMSSRDSFRGQVSLFSIEHFPCRIESVLLIVKHIHCWIFWNKNTLLRIEHFLP